MKKDKSKTYAIILMIEVIIFIMLLIGAKIYLNRSKDNSHTDGADAVVDTVKEIDSISDFVSDTVPDSDSMTVMSEPQSEVNPVISFEPHAIDSTKPENYLTSWEMEIDGQVYADVSGYAAASNVGEINFDIGSKYTGQEGVFTFRGNNFRDTASYGTAVVSEGAMVSTWSVRTGALSYEDAVWSGSGWTGQPLMRKWSRQIKKHMNMYDWAKEKDELVEVIYACMDGYIYFLDMETGEATRDKLWLGFTFKGAGALDPRGYPVLYLGAGYDSAEGFARAYIINLIDCSVLKEFGSNDPFALRGTLSYFDSSAVVDAETDTLIYPGENGVLYLIHLGTKYDEDKGSLSMAFDKTVKWRYNSNRTTHDTFWPGMETSPAIYEHYMYITDNGANLLCVDLNTLKPVWVQDILDDSNSTPVLSVEDGRLYVYVSTSFHLGWRSGSTANVPIWKFDAETGEKIWQVDYECYSAEGVSGGVQSTIAPGKESLDDYIFVTVSKTHNPGSGDIVAIRKSDGSKVWENQMPYTWSSPVCVYDKDGIGKVIYGASDGTLYELDGLTGEISSTLNISSGNIEASPAVYNDTLIIGTRAGSICGVKLR